MTRLFVDTPLSPDTEVVLDERAAHHVRSVLRLCAGDNVVLFDGNGGEYAARLLVVARGEVRLAVDARYAVERESPLEVTLVQSISRGERMDYTIQKAVELGVRHIVPVTSQRTVVRLDAARAGKRFAHWQGIVRHAAEQSGRTRMPRVSPVTSLTDWLATLGAGSHFLLSPAAPEGLAAQRAGNALTLVAGPEGGFADEEVAQLAAAGVLPVHLGPRTLRTETAAVSALSVVQALWGDLR